MRAERLANAVLEGEDPKDFLKRVAHGMRTGQFIVGQLVCRASGDTRDVMEECLNALRNLDRNRYLQEISDTDVFNYSSLGEASPDFDPEYYLYEHLFNLLQKYCPPISYFGSHPADGDIGCWPPDGMQMDELEDYGKLTHFMDNQPEMQRVLNGDFTGIDTPHVVLEWRETGNLRCYDTAKRIEIWRYPQ